MEQKCDKVKKILLGITIIFLFIFIYLLFLQFNIKNKLIIIIGIIGQLLLLIGMFIENNKLISISHVIYTLILLSTPIITNSRILLLICNLLSQFTLITRKKFDCMFEHFHNPINYGSLINWDYAYISSGFISAFKLYYYI